MTYELKINTEYLRKTPPSTDPNPIGGENNPEEGKCNNFKLRNNESRQENPEEKIGYIIQQYTVSPNREAALGYFLNGKVATSYLIDKDGRVDYLVDIKYAPYAVGPGKLNPYSFKPNVLNNWAVTIQNVNDAKTPFTDEQIEANAYLMEKIVNETGINPKYVSSHAHYAPSRMISPGPYFPWAKLAKASEHYEVKYNFGVFSFAERKKNPEIIVSYDEHYPGDVKNVQNQLEELGIKVLKEDKSNHGDWDLTTQRAILAFNLQNKGEEIINNPETLEAWEYLVKNSTDKIALNLLSTWDENNNIICADLIGQYPEVTAE